MAGGLGAARGVFTFCILLALALRPSAASAASHGTVRMSASGIAFYAFHVVLDGLGNATLDDGTLQVRADRIMLDLRANRYLAAGNVTVTGASVVHADAMSVDLDSHTGTIVSATDPVAKRYINGSTIGDAPSAQASSAAEPLALPDLGGEQPYAVAARAVAHVDADVRLNDARIIVPGGESLPLPSYVFTYAASPGYVLTNISTGGEDVPIYFGSTPNSIQGLHFSYNPRTKVAMGLDDHIVYSSRGYDLISLAPLIGPDKVINFTWQQQINDHTSQTLFSSTLLGSGTANNYDVRDSVHRSFLELSAFSQPSFHGATFAWQSFDQSIGQSQSAPLFFHLRSEYGFTHVLQNFPFAPFPADATLPPSVYHTAVEGYLGTRALQLNPSTSMSAFADARGETDVLPHRQLAERYGVQLDKRWSGIFSTNFADSIVPVFDQYPSVGAGYHSHINDATARLTYYRGDPLSITIGVDHATARSDNPFPPIVNPWSVNGDVRFRINPSLSLELNRTYYFGFLGQRYSAWGIQIFP